MRDAYTRCVQMRRAFGRSGSKASRLPVCNFYSQLAFFEHASECSTPTVTNISILDVSDDSTSTEGNAQNEIKFNKTLRRNVT